MKVGLSTMQVLAWGRWFATRDMLGYMNNDAAHLAMIAKQIAGVLPSGKPQVVKAYTQTADVSRFLPAQTPATQLRRLFNFAQFTVRAATGNAFPEYAGGIGSTAQISFVAGLFPALRVTGPGALKQLSDEEIQAGPSFVSFDPSAARDATAAHALPAAVAAEHAAAPRLPPEACCIARAVAADRVHLLSLKLQLAGELVHKLVQTGTTAQEAFDQFVANLDAGKRALEPSWIPGSVFCVPAGLGPGVPAAAQTAAPAAALRLEDAPTRHAFPVKLTPAEAYHFVSRVYF